MSPIVTANRLHDLYLVDTTGRIVFIPKNWCDDFPDPCIEEDGLSIYCWYGNEDVTAWEGRSDKSFLTTDAQAWFSVTELERLRQVNEAEARHIDPDLFRLLNAVNSGEAV